MAPTGSSNAELCAWNDQAFSLGPVAFFCALGREHFVIDDCELLEIQKLVDIGPTNRLTECPERRDSTPCHQRNLLRVLSSAFVDI